MVEESAAKERVHRGICTAPHRVFGCQFHDPRVAIITVDGILFPDPGFKQIFIAYHNEGTYRGCGESKQEPAVGQESNDDELDIDRIQLKFLGQTIFGQSHTRSTLCPQVEFARSKRWRVWK